MFNLSRFYGSTIGIALVLDFFYDNTQAMHVALAKDLAPYRAAAHVMSTTAGPGLAALNDMITGQAAFIGVIDQFEVMMIAMLIVTCWLSSAWRTTWRRSLTSRRTTPSRLSRSLARRPLTGALK